MPKAPKVPLGLHLVLRLVLPQKRQGERSEKGGRSGEKAVRRRPLAEVKVESAE
jgi:hypothetical protein